MPIGQISRSSTSTARLSSSSFDTDPVKSEPRIIDMPTSEITPGGTSTTSLQDALTSEITPCGTSTTSLQDALTSEITPRGTSTTSLQDALSPAQSLGTSTIIAIAVKAHEKLRLEPFAYAFHQLLQHRNCKVVVICCLSRVQSEIGHNLMIDDSFGGISSKKLTAAVNEQENNLNHYLKAFREELDKKGVALEVEISVGRKSEDALVQAAKTLHPLWVVLDISWATFSGSQHKTIRAALPECNLVVMKTSKPPIVHRSREPCPPLQESHHQVTSEEPVSDTSSPSSRNSSSSLITAIIMSEVIPSSNPEITSTITTEAPSSTQSTQTVTGETSSSNGTTPTITPETSSSNWTTPAIVPQETSSLNGAPEFSSSNWTIPTATSEISSSSGTTPSITAESSSANGTPATTTTTTETFSSTGIVPSTTAETSSSDMSVRGYDTTSATTSNTNSKSESGTSAQATTIPSPPPSQVAKPGRLRDIFTRFTSPAPLFPNLTIPLYDTPNSGSGTSSPQGQAYRRSPSNPGSWRSSPQSQANQRSPLTPITPSPSGSVTSTDGSYRNRTQKTQVMKISKILSDSGRHTVQANRNASLRSEDASYEKDLAVAMQKSIQSAIQEGIPLSRSSREEGGPTREAYNRTDPDHVGELGYLADQRNYIGLRSGLGTSTADILHQYGSPQPTPYSSPILADNPSQSFAPSAPPLPIDGAIRYPSVDMPSVEIDIGYPRLPADQKQKAEEKSSRCVICLDAQPDAACIPCGHVVGCKNCLTEAKRWGCPVCRAKIEQIVKLYL